MDQVAALVAVDPAALAVADLVALVAADLVALVVVDPAVLAAAAPAVVDLVVVDAEAVSAAPAATTVPTCKPGSPRPDLAAWSRAARSRA